MPDWFARRITTSLAILAALSRVGLHTALARAAMKPATDVPMPPGDRTVLVRVSSRPRNVRMAARETPEIRLSASILAHVQSTGLPDVPVTTLVGEQTDPSIPAVMLDVSRSEMRTHPHGRFVAARPPRRLSRRRQVIGPGRLRCSAGRTRRLLVSRHRPDRRVPRDRRAPRGAASGGQLGVRSTPRRLAANRYRSASHALPFVASSDAAASGASTSTATVRSGPSSSWGGPTSSTSP
jgi:hypothetical protein